MLLCSSFFLLFRVSLVTERKVTNLLCSSQCPQCPQPGPTNVLVVLRRFFFIYLLFYIIKFLIGKKGATPAPTKPGESAVAVEKLQTNEHQGKKINPGYQFVRKGLNAT